MPTSPTELSYDAVGATAPSDPVWAVTRGGYRRYESTTRIGQGPADWAVATEAVQRWAVKTRSGFSVSGDPRVGLGDVSLVARLGPLRIREPARVVAVVDEPGRLGFAYGTRPGHPVSGEEAFIVHRAADGSVWLTVRSLTRAPRGRWLVAYPAALLLQRVYRRRYRRALVHR